MKLQGIVASAAAMAVAIGAASPALADFSGPYFGAYTGFLAATAPVYPVAGVHGGYSFSNGGTVFGVEAEFGLLSTGSGFAGVAGVAADFGLVVSENARFYGVAGVSALFAAGTAQGLYSFGLGIEFPVGQKGMTVFIEPRAAGIFGSGCCVMQIELGFNWRP
jgi:hypothetical protein